MKYKLQIFSIQTVFIKIICFQIICNGFSIQENFYKFMDILFRLFFPQIEFATHRKVFSELEDKGQKIV